MCCGTSCLWHLLDHLKGCGISAAGGTVRRLCHPHPADHGLCHVPQDTALGSPAEGVILTSCHPARWELCLLLSRGA